MIHCPTIEKLNEAVAKPSSSRRLLFTDEGLLDVVQKIDASPPVGDFEVALFIISPIVAAAQKIWDTAIVKYLIGVQPANPMGAISLFLLKNSQTAIFWIWKNIWPLAVKFTSERLAPHLIKMKQSPRWVIMSLGWEIQAITIHLTSTPGWYPS